MRRGSIIMLMLLGIIFTSGCGNVRLYLKDQPRKDQELPAGAEDQFPDRNKTRKVIVLEVKDEIVPVDDAVVIEKTTHIESTSKDGASRVVTESKDTTIIHKKNFTFPDRSIEDLKSSPKEQDQVLEEYIVQKDDTLQKISKKYYDSYSKWPRIYELNKSVIKNPNFLKPGTKLQIPLEKGAMK